MKSYDIGPVELMVIQGSPFCNINCKYCYLPDRLNKKRISVDTVVKSIDHLIDDELLGDAISFVWHAGEPLAVPFHFYQDLFDIISQKLDHLVKVNHHIQTNAMLLNQRWIDFILKHEIKVGVSIDGPQHLNDINRLSRSGRSTYAKTMAGIQLLKDHNIPFHAIAVIGEKALDFPAEIYSFFSNMGVTKLGINIEEIEGINQESSLRKDQLTRSKCYSFFQVLNELQIDADTSLHIRELDDAKSKIAGIPLDYFSNHGITQQNKAYQIISVDIKGDFSSFSPELIGQESEEFNNFILGNVHESSFKEASHTELFQKLYGEIQNGIEKCSQTCPYFSFCGGGAPANKYYENGTFNSTETMLCKYSIQIPLEVVTSRLEQSLSN